MMESIRQLYATRPREEMLRYVPPSRTRVLDVGCAAGTFGAQVKKRGRAEVWGIELDPASAAEAAQVLDRVIAKDAFSALAELPAGYFDCVVFNDVLEHLTDPYKLLGEIKRHLTPDGLVVASIPNVRYVGVVWDLIARGNWDYQDWGVLDRTHLRFFTLHSIQKMFVGLGYDVERIDGINATRVGNLANKLLPRRFADIPFMQFACVARPARAA
jgi:2-polyprenyl-3-methyl-5-hydroxy-6-metoxy-1,4-benzoquinol methylase